MKKPENLSLEDAIKFLQHELERMKKQPRGDLDMDPDTAFEKGYEICIADLIASTRKRGK